jgi:RNA-directed DNA polymerase
MRNKVRELQRDLYWAAKTNPKRCFHSLYDKVYKVYRSDVLWEAWKRVEGNGGVAGNDGETIEGIIDRGEVKYLKEIQEELKERRYRAKSMRRVYIPKSDGRKRPLGIPRIRCRIIQGAIRYRAIKRDWQVLGLAQYRFIQAIWTGLYRNGSD